MTIVERHCQHVRDLQQVIDTIENDNGSIPEWLWNKIKALQTNPSAQVDEQVLVSGENARNNANLIHAAPELLKCVEGMLESFNLCMAELPEGWYKDSIRGYFTGEPERAIATIKKARGE